MIKYMNPKMTTSHTIMEIMLAPVETVVSSDNKIENISLPPNYDVLSRALFSPKTTLPFYTTYRVRASGF
jgi:hypothetical protein